MASSDEPANAIGAGSPRAGDALPSPPTKADDPRGAPGAAARKSERPSQRPGGLHALIGTTLSGRYRIERVIGEGGMGAVYQAEHTHMRKRVAVKVLHPEMSRMREVVTRFEREAMAAAHIDHPNVATATDFGKLDDGSFFLVLEFVEGKSLRDALGKSRLSLGRALHVTRQIASGLARAHALGIVHRDLKPENVMLVEREGDPDFVKILDFGIAKVPVGEFGTGSAQPGQPVLTQLGMVYGTPEYMAPEQALGQTVDATADLYALGVMAYEMLTGVRPFEHESKVALLGMHVTAPVPAMADKAPDAGIPPEVEALVRKLLAKESTKRFTDAKDLIDAIYAVAAVLAAQGHMTAIPASSALSAPLNGSPDASQSNPAILLPAVLRAPSAHEIAPTSLHPSLVNSAISLAQGQRAMQDPMIPGSTPVIDATRLNSKGRGLDMRIVLAVAGVVVLLCASLVTYFVVSAAVRAVAPNGSASGASSSVSADPSAASATPDRPRTPVPPAVEEKIKDASAQLTRGNFASAIEALTPIEASNPDRGEVHHLLMRAYVGAKRTVDAMREAGLWIKADDDKAILDDDLEIAVRNAALGLGDGGVDDAFALLESQMKTIGIDLLYGIAFDNSTQGYKPAVARATTLLLKPDVRGRASPALLAALDLRVPPFKTCDQLHAVLGRAKDQGDGRALTLLRSFSARCGGGFFGHAQPCYPCMSKDTALKDATAAIEARTAKK